MFINRFKLFVFSKYRSYVTLRYILRFLMRLLLPTELPAGRNATKLSDTQYIKRLCTHFPNIFANWI